ncbi:MAG: hypothetical protein ACJ735_05805 [Actinomycetes bacterium]
MTYDRTDFQVRITIQHPKGQRPSLEQVQQDVMRRIWKYDGGAAQGGRDLNLIGAHVIPGSAVPREM